MHFPDAPCLPPYWLDISKSRVTLKHIASWLFHWSLDYTMDTADFFTSYAFHIPRQRLSCINIMLKNLISMYRGLMLGHRSVKEHSHILVNPMGIYKNQLHRDGSSLFDHIFCKRTVG